MFQVDAPTQQWLEAALRQFGAVAGTVHQEHGGDLYLTAACNIPPPVLERVGVVPRGKGMAGLAQVRREPIQTCNLQVDDTGRINPMARLVGGQAAVALPVADDAGGIRAVVGLAFSYEGEVPAAEVTRMSDAAAGVPRADPQALAEMSVRPDAQTDGAIDVDVPCVVPMPCASCIRQCRRALTTWLIVCRAVPCPRGQPYSGPDRHVSGRPLKGLAMTDRRVGSKLGVGAALGLAAAVLVSAQAPAPAARQGGPGRDAGTAAVGRGRGTPIGVQRAPLGDGPFGVDSAEVHKIRVVVVTNQLAKPWSLAFLPDGSMLVTELQKGQLRIIRHGVLDPQPIAGVPKSRAVSLGGLMDVVLHPRFAENQLVYLTYSKPDDKGQIATALARGRWDGSALTDVRDLFVAEPYWSGAGGAASRLAFAPDGMLYMTTGASSAHMMDAQEPGHDKGKVLRLRDDGTVPSDNPFVGKAGYKPEIYSLGHRNQLGLAIQPGTGAVWSNENGPNGGDEINLILPGRNYGWPIVSLGRDYAGPWQGKFAQEGIEAPLVYWTPAIAVSGMAFYTGDRFPQWQGNVFVGALRFGEIANTGHLQRIVFNARNEELRREMLLTELRQRIRDVRQGPDGLLYLLTDENPGALLRIEPAQ